MTTAPITAPIPPPARWDFARLTTPASEPVSLIALKAHAKIEHDFEDALLEGYLRAARASVEKHTNRVLVAQNWRGAGEAWPQASEDGRIRVTLTPPPAAIVSVTVDGVAVDAALYALRGDVLVVDGDVAAPSGDTVASEVAVTFTAGVAAASVDEMLLLAIKMLAMHYHSNREPIANTWQAQPVPLTFQSLLQPFVVLSIL